MIKKKHDGRMLMRGIYIDAIYGENGRHQDLGPHGEPIMTPRLEVHGKVHPYLPLSPSIFPSPLPLTAQLTLRPQVR